MLRKENDCYKKLTLLNDSQENIIAVFNQTGALAIMACKMKLIIQFIRYLITLLHLIFQTELHLQA